jgi:hypothetical protein
MSDRLHFNPITLQRQITEEARKRKEIAGFAGVSPDTIATINTQGIRNILVSDFAKIYSGMTKPVKKSKYISNPETANFYKELHQSAASLLTAKESSPQGLMWKTNELQKELTYAFNNTTNSFTHWGDVETAFDKFNDYMAGDGGMAVLDIETLGGKNVYGKQETTKLTEFAFHMYDHHGADPRKVAGFIGLSANEESDMLKLADRLDSGAQSEQDIISFRRFAKMGHANTHINEDAGTRGRFNVGSWVGDDIEDIYNRENFVKGVSRARQIGAIQEAHKTAEGVMVWQKDLIDTMAEIQNKQMLVSGYNANVFDNPVLNQQIMKLDPAARAYAKKKGLTNFNIEAGRSFDLFALMQHAGVDPTFAGSIYEGEHGKALGQSGLTPFSQEALVNRFFPDIYKQSGMAAHTADMDVTAYHKLLTEAQFDGDLLANSAFKVANDNNRNVIQSTLKSEGQQLFMATGAAADGFAKQNIFGFTVDNFTGNMHTFDGYEMGDYFDPRATFKEYGTKKGVSYTINDMRGISANSDYVEKMRKVNPALAVDDLVMLELGVVAEGTGHPYADMVSKNSLKTYMVGTQEDVKSWMANNMMLYAEKDGEGEYRLVNGAKENLQKHYLDKQADKVVPVKDVHVDNDMLIRDTIRDGSDIHMNDSAARIFREDSYQRYQAFANLSKELDIAVGQGDASTDLLTRKRKALAAMLDVSKQAAKTTANNVHVDMNAQHETIQTLQSLLSTKGNAGRHTIDNIIVGLEHYESISGDVGRIMGAVNERVNGITDPRKKESYAQFLFKQAFDAVKAKALDNVQSNHFDMHDGYVLGHNKNYFELDIAGMFGNKAQGTTVAKAAVDQNSSNFLRVNLRAGGEYNLVSSLLRKLDMPSEVYNNQQEAMKQLYRLVEHGKGQGLGKLHGEIEDAKRNGVKYFENHTPATFAQRIISELGNVRTKSPTAGYLSPNMIHKVTGPSQMAGKLTDNDWTETLKILDNFSPDSIHNIARGSDGASSRASMAANVVDNFLMDAFNPQLEDRLSREYGYSAGQISKLKLAHKTRRNDYVSMMSDMFEGLSETKLKLFTDKKTGKFGLLDGDEYIDLTHMPRDRFQDGIFHTQVGRQKFSSSLVLGTRKGALKGHAVMPSDFQLRSTIGEAHQGAWSLKHQVRDAVDRGEDPARRVMSWLGKIAGNLREGSSVAMLDEQDIKSQFEVGVSDIVDAMPKLFEQGVFNDVHLEDKKEMSRLFTRKGFKFSGMDDTDKQLWGKNSSTILQHLSDNYSQNDDIKSIVDGINTHAKSSAAESGRMRHENLMMEFELYNKGNRDIENQTRFLGVREDVARARMRALGIDGDVLVGTHVKSALGYGISERKFDGISEKVHTEFTATRMHSSARHLSDSINDFRTKNRDVLRPSEEKALDVILTRGNMTEGGAIGDARIADAMAEQYDIQKISFKKQLDVDSETAKEIKSYNKIIPEIKIDEDGKVEFTYKQGKFARKFEKIAATIEYGDKVHNIAAKDAGVVKYGFFSKGGGILATEQEVIQRVQVYAGKNIRDHGEFMTYADQLYDSSFYVDKLTTNTNRKLMEDRSEKHMTAFLHNGLGDADERVGVALDNMGLSSLKRQVLRTEYHNQLKTGNLAILSQINKSLTPQAHEEAIKKAGFKDVAEFGKALDYERYLPSEMMKRALGAHFVLYDETTKHASRAAQVRTGINVFVKQEMDKLRGNGKSIDEARLAAEKHVYDKIKDAFVHEDGSGLHYRNGRMELENMEFGKSHINREALEDTLKTHLGEEKWNGILEGREGHIDSHNYGVMNDWTGMSAIDQAFVTSDAKLAPKERTGRAIYNEYAKGAKVTDRELNMLEVDRYSQGFVDRLKQHLTPDEFKEQFGHVVDADGKITKEYNNRAVMRDFTQEIRQSQFAKPGQRLISGDSMRGASKDRQRKILAGARALQGMGYKRVSLESAEEVHAAAMGVLATEFNANNKGVKSLEKHGFKHTSLTSIDRMTGGDIDWLKHHSSTSLYEHDMIIDLKEDGLITDKMLKGSKSGRYIALSQTPLKSIGGNVLQSEQHKAVNSLLRVRNNLRVAKDNGGSADEIAKLQQNFVDSVNKFADVTSKTVSGKDGLVRGLSEYRLDKSTSGKGFLMDVIKGDGNLNLNSSIVKDMQYGGKSILDNHNAGKLVDFKVVSEEAFENMGFFKDDYMQSVGAKNREEMIAKLRTDGVMAMSHRHPTVYKGADRPVQLYMSDMVKGNMAIEYAAGGMRAKLDADGDTPKTSIVRFRNASGELVDNLQHAHDTSKHAAASIGFKNQSNMMLHNALVENHFFTAEAKTNGQILRDVDDKVRKNRALMHEGDVGELMHPRFGMNPTAEQRNKYLKTFNETSEAAVQKYVDQNKVTHDEARAVFSQNLGKHVEYLSEVATTDQQKLAANFWVQDIQNTAAGMSKLKRASAGQINLPLYQVRKIRQMGSSLLSPEEHGALEATLEAAEEGFLSPKHSDSQIIDNARTMREFNTALRSATGAVYEGESAGTELLEQWLAKNARVDRLTKGAHREVFGNDESAAPKVFKSAANSIEKLFSNMENVNQYNSFLQGMGTRRNGIQASRLKDALITPSESEDLMTSTTRAMRAVIESPLRDRTIMKMQPPITNDIANAAMSSRGAKKAYESDTHALLNMVQSKMNKANITGKGLAFGVLGLAGATMLAGFVGGNPSKPAETHAQDEASDEGYQIPQLTDTNLNNVRGGPKQGYVININAQTKQGQQHASSAIQQALSTGFSSTNINVAMNVHNSGNANAAQVSRMLESAFQ